MRSHTIHVRMSPQVHVSAVDPATGLVLLAEATPYNALLMREGLWRERALLASSALPKQVCLPAASTGHAAHLASGRVQPGSPA